LPRGRKAQHTARCNQGRKPTCLLRLLTQSAKGFAQKKKKKPKTQKSHCRGSRKRRRGSVGEVYRRSRALVSKRIKDSERGFSDHGCCLEGRLRTEDRSPECHKHFGGNSDDIYISEGDSWDLEHKFSMSSIVEEYR